MKKSHLPLLILLTALLSSPGSTHAQIFTERADFTVNLAIGDAETSGLADTQTFSSSLIDFITDVNVTLNISGNFNGDLYAYLAHHSGFAVLLNRPGRTGTDPFGYSDAGFQVTFDDQAANGDIHNYRITLGDPTAILNTPVTGAWQPDARATDPGAALDTDPRTAFLSTFVGLDPNGDWTLFLADISPGGTSVLNSWSLEIAGVPEPGTWALASLGAGIFLLSAWRRRAK